MNHQNHVPLVNQESTEPPSYDQATVLPQQVAPGTYPAQQAMYPTVPPQQVAPGTYPTQQTMYPTVPATYPTVAVTYPYGDDPAMVTGQPQWPIAMEKEPVQTVCGGCHNQVFTSVDSSLNGSAVGWIIYSVFCCWCYGFFLLCMDHFKSWKHSCPNCRMVLKEFTPNASGGTIACLVCAIVVNVILVVLFFLGGGFRFRMRY